MKFSSISKSPSALFHLFLCILLSLSFTSCDRSRVMEVNQQIEGYKWGYDDSKSFEADISDTAARYNVYVNLRHSFEFDWRNVWVQIETTFPDGKSFSKRVNLVLSEANGHWLGDCLGDNCDMQLCIQQDAIFPELGKYKFRITQDMRVNPLEKIKSVGVRIEKVQK